MCPRLLPPFSCSDEFIICVSAWQVGYVYRSEAKQHLGGIGGTFAEWREKAHIIKETWGALKYVLAPVV